MGGKTGKKRLAEEARYDKLVKATGAIPKAAAVHLPPRQIDVDSLAFDDAHINGERSHNVTREQAVDWIESAKVSLTVWNGTFERYYTEAGATYVNLKENCIRTAFSKDEYDEKTSTIMEELKKHGY